MSEVKKVCWQTPDVNEKFLSPEANKISFLARSKIWCFLVFSSIPTTNSLQNFFLKISCLYVKVVKQSILSSLWTNNWNFEHLKLLLSKGYYYITQFRQPWKSLETLGKRVFFGNLGKNLKKTEGLLSSVVDEVTHYVFIFISIKNGVSDL